MKASMFVAAIASAVLSASGAYADDAHHPDKKDAPAISAPAKDTKASVGKGAGASMAPMQKNMKKMHEQAMRMHDAKDPAERQKLMQEHMQAMQENMKMMQGMMGGGMMGQGMMGSQSGKPAAPTEQRMQMMEQRMDMMQQMMEQMLKHQEEAIKTK